MPYKNPENKRRWEQEHRQLRNAQRRQRHLNPQSGLMVPKRVPDPVSPKETASGWKFVVGIGVLVLAVGFALLGTATPLPRPPAN